MMCTLLVHCIVFLLLLCTAAFDAETVPISSNVDGDSSSRQLPSRRRRLSSATCRWETTTASNPPVYWINLAANVARRQYMETQFRTFGFQQNHRIEAISPNSTRFRLLKLQKPCKRNTDKDLACIMSHLTAIYHAVYDVSSSSTSMTKGRSNSDVALIMEDDVKMLFHINFTALIETAPKDFGILQLVTSNEEAVQTVWSTFKQTQPATPTATTRTNIGGNMSNSGVDWTKKLWTRNLWTTLTRNKRFPLFWSTQAYLINKKVIKAFIDDVIEATKDDGNSDVGWRLWNRNLWTALTRGVGFPLFWSTQATPAAAPLILGFKLINSFAPEQCDSFAGCRQCKRTKEDPCILAQCLFADTYIYAGGGPTYVSNLPLFTGASIGLTSSIHQDQVLVHKSAFDRIDTIVSKIRHHHQRLGMSKAPQLGGSMAPTVNNNITSFHGSVVPYLIDPSGCIP